MKEKWHRHEFIMLQICLDGPAGSGKSTLAKSIAKALDITYLDTGAMYRAFTLFCLRKSITISDEKQVVSQLPHFNLKIEKDEVFLNEVAVTDEIRSEAVSKNVSAVSSYGEIRSAMVALQREIANNQPIVMDGRDIGTVVLPSAPWKFFIVASAKERANRRYLEQIAKGMDVSYDKILADMELRDYLDSTREIAPLKPASDAIHIDTSHLSIDQVVEKILAIVDNKV